MPEKQEALPELPKSSGKPIKYTVGHYRNKEVSHEDFVKWFTHEHLPAVLSLFKKHNISKYTLDMGGLDAVLEYWLHDLNDLKALVADPDWAAKAVEDEDKCCDLSRSRVHIGFDTPYLLESGEVINLPK
ncbi:hypothetical protein VMCG_00504 [Cytospora schulzeri]|uniref:Uncharacterized protein n=1 Tax=Cytospora schulzeri TaxID=448051 RepID=A0A423X9M4_9PEZI|nr:hypothetical protein VMCG_00504 [Valsa malicola]